MSSPNEPGYPRAGDGGANGSGRATRAAAAAAPRARSGTEHIEPERIADPTEVPPWQRGRAAKPANRPADSSARPDAARRPNSGGSGHSPGVDARLNRFLSGGAAGAPQQDQDSAGWADAPRARTARRAGAPRRARTARTPATGGVRPA